MSIAAMSVGTIARKALKATPAAIRDIWSALNSLRPAA